MPEKGEFKLEEDALFRYDGKEWVEIPNEEPIHFSHHCGREGFICMEKTDKLFCPACGEELLEGENY